MKTSHDMRVKANTVNGWGASDQERRGMKGIELGEKHRRSSPSFKSAFSLAFAFGRTQVHETFELEWAESH